MSTFSRAATSPNRNGKGAVPPPCWFLSACDRQRSRGAASPSRTQPASSQRLSSTPPRLPSLPQRELIPLSIPHAIRGVVGRPDLSAAELRKKVRQEFPLVGRVCASPAAYPTEPEFSARTRETRGARASVPRYCSASVRQSIPRRVTRSVSRQLPALQLAHCARHAALSPLTYAR